MVYEALTGANPFRARTPDELRERHKHQPRSLGDLRPDLPRSLAAACARALESQPRRRPSATAFARVLAAAADAIERPGHGEAAQRRRARRWRRARWRRRSPPWQRGRRARRLHAVPSLPGAARICPALPVPAAPAASTLDVSGWAAAICPLRPRGAVSEARAAHRPPGRRQRLLRRSRSPRCSARFPFWPPGLRCRSRVQARRSRWPRRGSPRPSRSRSACRPSATSRPGSRGARRWPAACGCSPACVPAAAPCCPRSRRCSQRSLLWPLYVLAAGSLRSALGRALAGAAGPFAIALWASVPLAGGYAGSADARRGRARPRCTAVGAPLLAAERRLGARGRRAAVRAGRRAARRARWASGSPGCLRGRSCVPALAGAAPEAPGRSVVAIWAVAILLALGVRAPDDDAPAGKPVPAEE